MEKDAKLDEALRESFPASDAPASLSEQEPEQRKVGVIIGSLRKGAYSRMAANALLELAPPTLSLSIIEIGDLTLFNQDLEENPPQSWIDFRNKVRGSDAIIFVTPEYNRSVPAPIKNAVDIGSRPPKENLWDGMPGSVVSTSPGILGGISANYILRQSLGNVNVSVMSQPNVSLSSISKLVDEDGKLVDEGTRKFLASFLVAFGAWVEKQLR